MHYFHTVVINSIISVRICYSIPALFSYRYNAVMKGSDVDNMEACSAKPSSKYFGANAPFADFYFYFTDRTCSLFQLYRIKHSI